MYNSNNNMTKYINKFYLDKEKDIVVSIYKDNFGLYYVINTPNHHTGNLITNLAKISNVEIKIDENGMKYISEYLPSYVTARNTIVYIMRLADIKVANINEDGVIEQKATIPAINKTLMSQTKDYKLKAKQTIIKTYIKVENKFKTDLHTHMNGNLSPDGLIALGIYHEIAYPLYYIKKLNLIITKKQSKYLNKKRKEVEKKFNNSELTGKYLERRIDDNVALNFADLILNNIDNANDNITKIRNSLTILKDSQAVFTNLEKLYLYRYVFTKAKLSDKHIGLKNINLIEDEDIKAYVKQMILDHKSKEYKKNTLLQDKLLWIARDYKKQGIEYIEISNTTLVKYDDSLFNFLNEIHDILPKITNETGVVIRFLAALRRTPLNLIKDAVTPENYLRENLDVIKAVAKDPYVAGCDFVGEEINDIEELQPVIKELVEYANTNPYFTIRIHAGENDSLKDNVSNSIKCVKNSLSKNQKMPQIRIGHGLYTENLNTIKGKKLISDLKKYSVILEFQLTSNVRLNNLTNIDEFPLKKYLNNGIKCVQGSDGCGLYGITPMEEQLSLENLANLTSSDIKAMCDTEKEVINANLKAFKSKEASFNKFLNGRSIKDALICEIEKNKKNSSKITVTDTSKLDSSKVFVDKIKKLPLDKLPIIIAGGSFNTAFRKTKSLKEDKVIIDKLLKGLDPNRCYFVIGNKLSGYEKYLLDNNSKGFDVFAIVPSLISKDEYDQIEKYNINICVSIETLRMALYKSFNYEIFERRSSVVVALDGNSAGANLIQEAKNGKAKALIYVSKNATPLIDKAKSLKGYVKIINNSSNIVKEIKSLY